MLIKLHKCSLLNLTEPRKPQLASKPPSFKNLFKHLSSGRASLKLILELHCILLNFIEFSSWKNLLSDKFTPKSPSITIVRFQVWCLSWIRRKRNVIKGFRRKRKGLQLDYCHLEKLFSFMYMRFKGYFFSG